MAHRYVPKTYNNRRFMRIVTGAVITVVLAMVILFLVLFFVFQRYVVDGQLQIPWLAEEFPVITASPEPSPTIAPTATPSPTPTPEPEAGSDDDADDEGRVPTEPDTYTLEQIEAALQPQFMSSAYGERNPQVVSVKEVERDRDTIKLDSDLDVPAIDLTNSLRYKVEFIFDQPETEFMIWEELNRDVENKPYRREGDRTVMTEHYYFNDEDGEPILAFIR